MERPQVIILDKNMSTFSNIASALTQAIVQLKFYSSFTVLTDVNSDVCENIF